MAEAIEDLFFVRARGQGHVVGLGDTFYPDMAALLAAVPGLAEDPLHFAKAATHYAQGSALEVISDPAAFAESYRAKIEAETPGEMWQQGTYRLRDFGIPDFDSIQAPTIEGDAVVFYLRDTALGVPYRGRAQLDGTPMTDDDYSALSLSAAEPLTAHPSGSTKPPADPDRAAVSTPSKTASAAD